MAKDPAFLFYSQDFVMGTMFLTDEEVGVYIRLLCAQHQLGGIIKKKDFDSIVKGNERVTEKFIETDDGFYNKRLMEEMDKRNKKASNLSNNAKVRWEKEKQKQCKSNAIASDLHMPIENEDENEIEIKTLRINAFKKPSFEEVLEYCKERKNKVDPATFIDFYESKGWMVGKSKMKDWKASVRTWEKGSNSKPNPANRYDQRPEVQLPRYSEVFK